MKYISRLDGKKVEIKLEEGKKYGIMLSGGIDSAILLYLVLRVNPNIDIQPFTIPKTDGAYNYVNAIVDYFNKHFNISIPYSIKIGDPTVYHRLQSRTAFKEIFEKYSHVDYIFNGINQNPPELADEEHAPARDKKSMHEKIFVPFVELQKIHILDFMYEYKQEELMLLTHSCTEQPIGRCNVCWQCRERQLSFNKLNQKDKGTL